MNNRKRDDDIQRRMLEVAKEFLAKRYPTGWGGVAVLYTDDGAFLTSVAIEVENAGATLCIETGAICEAHKLRKRVLKSLCLVRESEQHDFMILTPCGICQERLLHWGDSVEVAVSVGGDQPLFKKLAEINLFHWSKSYPPIPE